jgi:hypothetical protein
MEDSIIVNYADSNPLNNTGDRIEFTGVRVSDTEYPTIGLHEITWINKDCGYSITLKIRKLDENIREAFNPTEAVCIN